MSLTGGPAVTGSGSRFALTRSGVVRVEIADRLPEGWRDWLQWNEACDRDGNTPGEEADMLRVDGGRLLGFAQLIAHRT